MPTRWIDFKALKAEVPVRAVLDRYGFTGDLQPKGPDKLVGPCPIHKGKNPGSFHVSVSKNAWHCFSQCGGGNVLDLVMKVEGCDIREAGEKLASWFGLTFSKPTTAKAAPPVVGNASPTSGSAAKAGESAATVRQGSRAGINPPLQRSLSLDENHAYLQERRLTIPTIKTFGVGYCSRGLMRGRIAIPIHDEKGDLVAYAGRAVDLELAKEKGKYLLPTGFHKSVVVYNLHRARERAGKGLIVVEGFFDCMKVHQAGFPNVVALMGSTLSEEQEQLLAAATDRLVLMFDGDEAGKKCVRQFYGRLRTRLFLKEVQLAEGEQPDNLPAERIRAVLG